MVDNQEKDIDQPRLIKKYYKQKSDVFGAVFGEGKQKRLIDEEVEGMEESQKFGFLGKDHSINFKKQKPREEKEERMINFMENKNYKKKMTTDSSGNLLKKPSCIICCKDFPSMKSLFGHMRCHPERDWRGIQPPSIEKNISSSSLSDDEYRKFDDKMDFLAADEGNKSVDLTESFKGWPVTNRRGRKAVSAASTSELSSSEDHQLRDAGDCLVMLARGDSNECCLKHMKKFDEFGPTNRIPNTKIFDTNPVYKSKERKIDYSFVEFRPHSTVEQFGNEEMWSSDLEKTFLKKDVKNCCSDDNQLDSKNKELQLNDTDFESTNFKGVIKNKKKRKQIKLCELEFEQNVSPPVTPIHPKRIPILAPTPQPTKYRCSTCDKSFPTHQALGGHKASHNSHKKFKITIYNSNDKSKNLSNPTSLVEKTKEIEKGSSSKLVEGRKLHQCIDFDLNEKPPLEDEASIKSDHAVGN